MTKHGTDDMIVIKFIMLLFVIFIFVKLIVAEVFIFQPV